MPPVGYLPSVDGSWAACGIYRGREGARERGREGGREGGREEEGREQ